MQVAIGLLVQKSGSPEVRKSPIIKGYACPAPSPAPDRLHRIPVASPQGDPSGITTAERYRRGLAD